METQESSVVSLPITRRDNTLDVFARTYGWEDVERPKTTDSDDDANMVFLAINRTYGRNSSGTNSSTAALFARQ